MQAAESTAAAHGQTLRQFVAAAVAGKLDGPPPVLNGGPKPWMKHYGRSAELAGEIERVKQVVEAEFEKVNLDDWK